MFYRDGGILIEHRPTESGKETFIPNGTIEEKDKGKKEDYRIVAMKREAYEEMQVGITEFEYLADYKVEEVKLWFYCYVVTGWEGIIPRYAVEEGKKFADLEWIPLTDYRKYFEFESAFVICKNLINHLESFKKI